MESTDHRPIVQTESGANRVHLLFPADASSVRTVLKTVLAALAAMDLEEDLPGVVEIVLAEVLNNIVEHAYAERGEGRVELEIRRSPAALHFRLRDEGVAMPDGAAPDGSARDLDVAIDDLPEGGFGWFLIRELTQALRYRRVDDRNELTFRIALDTPAQSA